MESNREVPPTPMAVNNLPRSGRGEGDDFSWEAFVLLPPHPAAPGSPFAANSTERKLPPDSSVVNMEDSALHLHCTMRREVRKVRRTFTLC